MLEELIRKAQKGNDEAMLLLLDKFNPLIKKYGRKLGYEDAADDIIIYFIEMLQRLDMDKMNCVKDEAIVAYIHTSIVNFYNKNVKKAVKQKQELPFSELTEEQAYYVETLMMKNDTYNSFDEMGLQNMLTKSEYVLMNAIYNEGYTVAEIARLQNKSRQSINQHKQRILHKIEGYLEH